jgi:hypothetical protein
MQSFWKSDWFLMVDFLYLIPPNYTFLNTHWDLEMRVLSISFSLLNVFEFQFHNNFVFSYTLIYITFNFDQVVDRPDD